MRPLPLIMKLPIKELSEDEKKYLANYVKTKNVRHSGHFIYHSRKLPEEVNGKTNSD